MMLKMIPIVLSVVIVSAQYVYATTVQEGPERTWSKVKYFGGAAGVRGKSMVWQNTLAISNRSIRLTRKNSVFFEIVPSSVYTISYSGHRHMNTDAVGLVAPVSVFAALGGAALLKSTDHYLIIEYTLSDGTGSGVLLQLHKENYKEILVMLHHVTGIKQPDQDNSTK